MGPTEHGGALPQLSGRPVVTDGGLETDLIYHHGVDLPDFAAFPLVDHDRGRDLLLRYYGEYVDIATRAEAALQLETPTWRASGDWGERLGYSASELRRVNRDSVGLLERLRDRVGLDTLLISGCLGPRGDGYVAGQVVDPDAAATYHTPQIEAFAEAGADLITALTLTGTGEAVGIVRAARPTGLPVAVPSPSSRTAGFPTALHWPPRSSRSTARSDRSTSWSTAPTPPTSRRD
jgi:homocysteine S-methyltransferase